MPYVEQPGDMFAHDSLALAHGCNARGFMGAGVAAIVRRKWPTMYREYRDLCLQDKLAVGTFMGWRTDDDQIIFNLITQDDPGPCARLDWIKQAVSSMIQTCESMDIDSVVMPRIGAGIGGLDWAQVRAVIEPLAEASPVKITVCVL